MLFFFFSLLCALCVSAVNCAVNSTIDQAISDIPVTVVFAGGGSGGHIAPGLAIAERLKEISPLSKSIFICSQRPLDAAMLNEAQQRFVPIPATPPAIKPGAVLRFLMNFRDSRAIVRKLLIEKNVDRVVALGGFVAAPVVTAARAERVPVMLVNLDAPPGKANQWLAQRCDEVFSAIDLPTMPEFAKKVVGMPIRRRALAPGDPEECRMKLSADPRKRTLLVTGASQGATSINSFMTEFVRANSEMFGGGPESWQIIHLTGAGADDAVRHAYESVGVNSFISPFLTDIGLAWGAADLAVSRAGASSVAEVAMNAVPTLFLPYPHHKDMHQKHNAQPLVDMGGAVMVDDQTDAFSNLQMHGPALLELMQDELKRDAMRQALRAHEFPDAAMTIARMLVATPVGAAK